MIRRRTNHLLGMRRAAAGWLARSHPPARPPAGLERAAPPPFAAADRVGCGLAKLADSSQRPLPCPLGWLFLCPGSMHAAAQCSGPRVAPAPWLLNMNACTHTAYRRPPPFWPRGPCSAASGPPCAACCAPTDSFFCFDFVSAFVEDNVGRPICNTIAASQECCLSQQRVHVLTNLHTRPKLPPFKGGAQEEEYHAAKGCLQAEAEQETCTQKGLVGGR